MPVAEAIRLILNETIENTRRRNRPMRIVGGDEFADAGQLMEYIPDNVIVTNRGKRGEIITVETPEITTSINLVQFLDAYIGRKTGISPEMQGASDQDTKVGVYYGTLQQSADRIGVINKEYSDNYAEKGYRYFWGLKDNLSGKKAIEMLGKSGIHADELTEKELADVDDVDDIIVSGGSREEEINEVKSQRQSRTLAEISGNPVLSQKINPEWLIRTSLKTAGFAEEDINQALDIKNTFNSQLIREADEAIQKILLGKTAKLNRGANTAFIQYIIDCDIDNIDFEKVDRFGDVIGINEKNLKISTALREYAKAQIDVALENTIRNARSMSSDLMKSSLSQELQAGASNEALNIPVPTDTEQQMQTARPFENGTSTEGATIGASQNISNIMSP